MSHEAPTCPFCKEPLEAGLNALDEHLQLCDRKTRDGQVYRDVVEKEDETLSPESLQKE